MSPSLDRHHDMQFSHTAQLFESDAALVDQFPNPVIAFNEHLIISYWNDGAELLYGYARHEAMGISVERLFTDNRIIKLTQGLKEGQEWRGESVLLNKNKSGICCMLYLAVAKRNKFDRRYIVIAKDIIEKQEAETRLNKINIDLEGRLQCKDSEMNDFFERIDYGFFSFDRSWCYTHINTKAARLLNRGPSELIGKNVWSEFPELVDGVFYKVYHEVFRTQEHQRIEEYSARLNKWFEVDIYPSTEGLSIFFKDVTERHLNQRKILETEERYRVIVETAQEGIWMVDVVNKITFVNPCLAKMLQYAPDEMVGHELYCFVKPGSYQQAEIGIKEADGDKERYELPLLDKSGRIVWVSIQTTSMFKHGQYVGSLGMLIDISSQKEHEAALTASRDELRQLAGHLQTIREEERASIARDIHDHIGQQLTALKMDIFSLSKVLNVENEIAQKKVSDILLMVSSTLKSVEVKAIELHPSLLHNLGLIAAIEWQNVEFQNRYGIKVEFSFAGSDKSLNPQSAIALFRIYQESFANVVRHSGATLVTSRYIQNENGFYLTIADNGSGFELTDIVRKNALGLLSMKERSVVIGGTCSIVSKPGKGTTVSCFVPPTEK
jgi:PAS domain S-box-containing protein